MENTQYTTNLEAGLWLTFIPHSGNDFLTTLMACSIEPGYGSSQ